MADAASVRIGSRAEARVRPAPRHTVLVRSTHWIATAALVALILTGGHIVTSHPRFYWGETGNVHTPALFQLPIPSSRASVPTGYSFVLPDQNGWSRDLHFEAAWVLILTGVVYAVSGLISGHLRKNLLPAGSDLKPGAFVRHLRSEWSTERDPASYNVLQRLTYLIVIFLLAPLMIWTGLAMSPAITSAYPAVVAMLGGHQSARTIHFVGTAGFLLFAAIHIAMICRVGFRSRTIPMITGRSRVPEVPG